MPEVLVFDATKTGLMILTPESLKTADPEDIQEFLDWVASLQRDFMRPMVCPFCKAPAILLREARETKDGAKAQGSVGS